jgi:hypothetical protein
MRLRSEKYLDFIRSLPCCVCHNDIETEACHVRFGDPGVGKPITGMGIKPDDAGWTVPMCGGHHRDQHSMGERIFWDRQGLNPLLIGLALFRAWALDEVHLGEQIILHRVGRVP